MTDTPHQPTVFDRFDNPADAYDALRRENSQLPYVDRGPEILARHEPPNPAKIDAALKAHGSPATTRWAARMNATKADRMPEGLEYLPAELDELEREQLNKDFAAGMYDEPATEQAASIARHPSQQPGISR